jgi:hypothetical protein
MGTVLYIVLRLVGMINTPVDLPIICLLISIDSMGVPALMKLIKK